MKSCDPLQYPCPHHGVKPGDPCPGSSPGFSPDLVCLARVWEGHKIVTGDSS